MIRRPPTRLLAQEHLLTAWRSAVRHTRLGRHDRALRLWHRAERALRSAGATLPRPVLRAFAVGRAALAEPPATPRASCRPVGSLPFITPHATVDLTRAQIEGFGRSCGLDLIVDLSRRRVTVRGREIRLEGCDVPIRLLAALVRAAGEPVRFERLFPAAWGRPYNPAYDATTIYFQVNRLRRILEREAPGEPFVIACRLAYRLAGRIRAAVIGERESARSVRGDRDALRAYLSETAFIDNRRYCQLMSVSASTAFRELRELVREGVLAREGAGRGARYRLAVARRAGS